LTAAAAAAAATAAAAALWACLSTRVGNVVVGRLMALCGEGHQS